MATEVSPNAGAVTPGLRVILSEAKNLFRVTALSVSEILRFAQNDAKARRIRGLSEVRIMLKL